VELAREGGALFGGDAWYGRSPWLEVMIRNQRPSTLHLSDQQFCIIVFYQFANAPTRHRSPSSYCRM